MANADGCYLNIPFKNHLSQVKVDDQASVARAAGQAFENWKAIERRINNPDCAGGEGCGCVTAEFYLNELTGGGTTITGPVSGSKTFDLIAGTFNEGSTVTLPLANKIVPGAVGLWIVTLFWDVTATWAGGAGSVGAFHVGPSLTYFSVASIDTERDTRLYLHNVRSTATITHQFPLQDVGDALAFSVAYNLASGDGIDFNDAIIRLHHVCGCATGIGPA